MPYIKKEKRQAIFKEQTWDPDGPNYSHINIEEIDCAGDIQYAIAEIIKQHVRRFGLSYQTCNDIMGALAGAQQEFYRRTVAPYEDKKKEENGDVI